MAEQIPSIDWPRRNVPLNGDEDLLRQNPAGDASDSPKEQRIPTSLILDYVLDNLPAENTVFTVNTGTSDPPATGATPVSSFFKNTNSGEWFVIDSTGDSYSLRDNLARVTSGTVDGTDLVLTRGDATGIIIDLSSLSSNPDGSETKIDAGTNISISGTGTIGDPYIVTNTYATGETNNLNGIIGRYNDPAHYVLGGSDLSNHQIASEYNAIITKSEGVNDGQYLHIKFSANPSAIGIMVSLEGVMIDDISLNIEPIRADCVMINFGGTSVSQETNNSWTADQIFNWYYSADNLPVLRITNSRNLIGVIDMTVSIRRAFSTGLTLPDVSAVVVNNIANHF